jgi:hypothetical protein
VLCRPTGDYRNSLWGDYPPQGTLGNVACRGAENAGWSAAALHVSKNSCLLRRVGSAPLSFKRRRKPAEHHPARKEKDAYGLLPQCRYCPGQVRQQPLSSRLLCAEIMPAHRRLQKPGKPPCLADETKMGILLERRELADRHATKHGARPPWFSPPFPFERDPRDYNMCLIKQFEIKARTVEALVRIHKAMYGLPSRSSRPRAAKPRHRG